jgi:hypothetical protein
MKYGWCCKPDHGQVIRRLRQTLDSWVSARVSLPYLASTAPACQDPVTGPFAGLRRPMVVRNRRFPGIARSFASLAFSLVNVGSRPACRPGHFAGRLLQTLHTTNGVARTVDRWPARGAGSSYLAGAGRDLRVFAGLNGWFVPLVNLLPVPSPPPGPAPAPAPAYGRNLQGRSPPHTGAGSRH